MNAPFSPDQLMMGETHRHHTVANRPCVPLPLRIRSPLRGVDRLGLYILVALGLASMVHYAHWWFSPGQMNQPLLFALLSLAMWYGMFRMLVV